MVSEAQISELRYQSDFNFEFNLKAGGELHWKIKLKLLLQYIVSPLCYFKQELEWFILRLPIVMKSWLFFEVNYLIVVGFLL